MGADEGFEVSKPLTSFIGRDREVTEVSKLLLASRLVSIIGPGGAGKTRLALEVIRRHAGSDGNSVRLADLTGIRDADQVSAVVTQAMGRPAARQRQVLLIDNCEHLIAACARAVELLLTGSPKVRVLITSRETLGIPAETVWTLPPLAAEDAARLFAERARARRPQFVIDAATRSTVQEICRRLDYMPLAIELAAARIGVMSAEEIRQRLDDRFALLTGGSRTAIDRHRTLRSTVAWSYSLMEPKEQRLFRQLSVFRGFDLEAAEAISGPGATATLSRLVEKSLVMVRPEFGPVTRYFMLETLSAYGEERLLEADEMEDARRRQLDFVLARAEAAFADRRRSGSAELLHRLDADLDNLRAAIDWCQRGDPCAGVRLVAATREVWFRMGQAEGLRAAREFLERCPARDLQTAWALLAAGNLAFTQLEHAAARRDLELAAAIGAELDDPAVQAWAAWLQGANRFLAEEFEEARLILEGGVELHRRSGDSIGLGLTLGSLGTVLLRLGDREGAIARLSEGLGLLEAAKDGFGSGFCHTYLGIAHAAGGERSAAKRHFQQALLILAPIRDVTMLTLSLAGLAELSAGSDWVRSLRLAGAASVLRERFGGPFPRWIATSVADLHQRGVSALGEPAAHRQWAAGRLLEAEAATALALGAPAVLSERVAPLSARETEIAWLVTDGLANSDIAGRLHLSRRTVENHVLHILNKLGLDNRTQIAAWLLRRD